MLSKSQISFVNALHHKKHRKEFGLFIAEGSKSIAEFIDSDYVIETIYCVPEVLSKFSNLSHKVKLQEISGTELQKISTLNTPQDALALIRIPERTTTNPESFRGKITLVLDGIQDPGNLGTIIRTADWFGWDELVCSSDTVEAYNPKVVQATMGSLSRIKIFYTNLPELFANSAMPVFTAVLEGESVYETEFGQEGFIVLGNEGKGLTEEVKNCSTRHITIPRFGRAESLNVAVSAAIICSELKRKSLK